MLDRLRVHGCDVRWARSSMRTAKANLTRRVLILVDLSRRIPTAQQLVSLSYDQIYGSNPIHY